MPRGRHEGAALAAFFKGLRGSALAAWNSPQGYAYDELLYAVSYPYAEADPARVLNWAGRNREAARLPRTAKLNDTLVNSTYPQLAHAPPAGLSAEGWSAVLHFLDPSYPLATDAAHAALRRLGFDLTETLSPGEYGAYLKAIDELKERAPVWAVPETNWYLARVLEVGLEAYAAAPEGRALPSARARA